MPEALVTPFDVEIQRRRFLGQTLYAKVILSLNDILDGAFFEYYIKKGTK